MLRVARWSSILTLALALGLASCALDDAKPSSFAADAEVQDESIDWSSMPALSSRATQGSPISLVSPDGVELSLSVLDARAVIEGPLALTELHLTFRNPVARQIEGEFEIILPESAAVSRLAMRVAGQWNEAEVVEKRRATATYERILHRRKDPLLLDRAAGNRFKARIFPISAQGEVEIIIAFSHALEGSDMPYQLALDGLPTIARMTVSVLESGLGDRGRAWRKRFALERMAFEPDRDLVIPRGEGTPGALRSGPFAIARVTVPGQVSDDPDDPIAKHERVDVLFDTSASLGPDLEPALAGLAGLLAELGASTDPTVRVVAFDQSVEIVFEGRASTFGAAEIEQLWARGSEGATDLAGVLHRLVAEGPSERVVVMSDGLPTVGERATSRLGKIIDALAKAGTRRLDFIAVARARDEATMAALTRGGLVIDGALDPDQVSTRLQRGPASPASIEVVDATWSWPTKLHAAWPGDELLVYAEVDDDGGNEPIRIRIGDDRVQKVEAVAATPALVRRAHAGARIESLTRGLDALDGRDRAAHIDQIISLSTEYRVLSPFTSMIVLETERDYEQFGIQRDALSDILTVAEHGVVTLQRSAGDGWSPSPNPAVEDDLASPSGALDLDLPPTDASEAPTAIVSDLDRDGIPDDTDACPIEPEDFDGDEDDDGCPDLHARISTSSILIDDKVYFTRDSSTVDARSHAVLDDVAMLLSASPELGRVEVGAHTDSKGGTKYNEELSRRRAQAVVDYLVQRGIPAERLSVAARGETVPIDTNRTPDGRANNRRVEFSLIDAGSVGTHAWASTFKGRRLDPHHGPYAQIQAAVATGDAAGALSLARAEHDREPGPLFTVAVGQAHVALGNLSEAARVFGSLIDARPDDAEQLRVAAAWLEHVDALSRRADGAFGARAIAIDALHRAVDLRPDHPTGHHQLAMALLRAGSEQDAFAVIEVALGEEHPDFRDAAEALLLADLGLITAAWIRAEPDRRAELEERAARHGASLAAGPSVHFVLTWDSDDTDADLYVEASSALRWCGTPDVTNGYGPECMVATGAALSSPLELSVHYARRGAMGDLFGRVQIIHHDGHGRVRFDDRPFVIQNEDGLVSLGTIDAPRP